MTAPTIPLRANAQLVAAATIRRLVTAYDTAVGRTLQGPNPETGAITWAQTGFVQVSTINGPIDPYVPMRRSVVSVDVWATNRGTSKKPPWGLAFSLAELIVAATFDTPVHDNHVVVTLPTGYPLARVTEFTVQNEPNERPSDQADYAHVGFEAAISWHALGTTWGLPT